VPIYSLGELAPQIAPDAWVADNATVIGSVLVESKASIWFNCLVRGDSDLITIGEGANIQDGSVLHTDPGILLTIGRNVTVGHMVMLHGCQIGDGALIGIGSIILNRAVIGKNCLIGANTLIPEGKTIPDRSLVMGSPGKIVRELSDEEVARVLQTSAHYVENAQRYRSQLRPWMGGPPAGA
jgi:carbonic anhydrase/acetyltransferase-like protein (isoleucine patch superfamily)